MRHLYFVDALDQGEEVSYQIIFAVPVLETPEEEMTVIVKSIKDNFGKSMTMREIRRISKREIELDIMPISTPTWIKA